MSLLLNEDFSTYLLRHAYLTHIPDGVGERLINLNTAVLNNPAFRAAGWLPDNTILRRCYSPPIPTTSKGVEVGNEYFRAPRRGQLQDEETQEGGMLTGQQGNEDAAGASLGLGLNERRKRQRTRKEQLEEDDSSDLSDEDSESDREKSQAQGTIFRKMPLRERSKSSPPPTAQRIIDEDGEDAEGRRGPDVVVTNPSKPPDSLALQNRGRGSSFSSGRIEAVKQRARRDTTTSSEMSSADEGLEPHDARFDRKLPGRPDQRAKKTVMLSERIQEEEIDDLEDISGEERLRDSDLEDEDEDVDEASDLSDEFEAAGGESPDLGMMGVERASDDPSPLKPPPQTAVPPPVEATQNQNGSPRKKAERELSLPKLPKLPPGRPMSSMPPPSLITMALNPSGSTPGAAASQKPFQRFADSSGKGEASPLWIKIYAPFSTTPTDAIEVPLRRTREGQPVTVSELIGLALWRYNEEEYQPPLTNDETDSNINRWDLRIVEDEEVDFDFPALGRTRPVTDFTSNNNRPPQRRARDKPWDEFGLVRAKEEQFKENEEMTPQLGIPTPQQVQEQSKPAARPELATRSETETSIRSTATATFHPAPRNPITGPSFAPAALRKDTGNQALDAPQRETAQSTPRTGAPKTVTVHFTDPQSFATSNLNVPTTTDTYIAEIFDHSCQKLGLEKGLYVLKVHGTQTVAPSDRTVEALGERLGLDLVRRRFIGGGGAGDGIFGLGLSGSPGSSSPNAPLEMLPQHGTPPPAGKKAKRGAAAFGGFTSAPNFATSSSTNLNLVGLGLALPSELAGVGGKRYNVLRKQPLSFSPSHPRTLIITPEYMQILPAAPDSFAAPQGKVTNVPMASVVGVKVSRKHPKMVRVLVYREKETKRYDFEAQSKEEAALIVSDVRRALDAGGIGLAA